MKSDFINFPLSAHQKLGLVYITISSWLLLSCHSKNQLWATAVVAQLSFFFISSSSLACVCVIMMIIILSLSAFFPPFLVNPVLFLLARPHVKYWSAVISFHLSRFSQTRVDRMNQQGISILFCCCCRKSISVESVTTPPCPCHESHFPINDKELLYT